MSCLGPFYNPVPARAWSRVTSPCTFPAANNTFNNTSVFLPLFNKYVSPTEIAGELQMYNKGNILQYKNNSSNLTKKQRYAQIAKGQWTNRTTTWASQNPNGFTDPNTGSLQRVGATNVFVATGLPTNLPPTCPLLYNSTPYESIIIATGGVLVCNTLENPCTNEVIVKPARSNCNPTSNSDVPGPARLLCWNDGNATWYPRQRYVMTAQGDKFPQGYKFLRPA